MKPDQPQTTTRWLEAKPVPPPVNPGASPASVPTILLVDDDPAVRESLGGILTTEGWQVIDAGTGEEALERLAESQPDLLITDLCLTDVSGWDLLFHEGVQRPYLPIFVITGLPMQEVGEAAHFAAMFFPKPLDIDSLLLAIRRHLRATRATPAPLHSIPISRRPSS